LFKGLIKDLERTNETDAPLIDPSLIKVKGIFVL